MKTKIEQYFDSLDTAENEANLAYNKRNYQTALEKYETVDVQFSDMSMKLRRSITNWSNKKTNLEIQIGRCHRFLGNKETAVKCFKKALFKDGNRLDALFELAKLYYEDNQYPQAETYISQCLDMNPEKYNKLALIIQLKHHTIIRNCYLILAEIAFRSGHQDTALKYYLKSENYYRVAKYYFVTKDYANAITYSKKALKEPPVDEDVEYFPHLFWGISLYHLIKNKSIPSAEDKQELELAFKLLDKAGESKSKDIIFGLAAFFDDEISEEDRDAKKVMQLYTKAAELKSTNAMQNLAFKYECGEDVEIDLNIAFAYYSAGASSGYVDSQTDLGRCYLLGKGCAIDLKQARFWLEKAADGHTLAKHFLSIVLCHEYEAKPDSKMASRIIQLMEDAAPDHPIAFFNLGLIYQHGKMVNQNLNLAESYFLKASSRGILDAVNSLLIFYSQQMVKLELSDPKYKTLEKTCYKLIEQNYGVPQNILVTYKLIELIKMLKIKEQKFCILINSNIDNISKKQIHPERKIALLLSGDCKPQDSINIATMLLKISHFLDLSAGGTKIFNTYKSQIIQIIVDCKQKLIVTDFSLRCICNLITGISKLYRHGYDRVMDSCLNTLFEKLNTKTDEIVLTTVMAVLPASTRIPLHKKNFITTELRKFLDSFVSKAELLITKDAELALLGYSLAMLDCYKKHCPELKLQINKSLLEKVFKYCFAAIDNLDLNIEARHQAYLASVYFLNHYPHFLQGNFNLGTEHYSKLFEEKAKQVKTSNSQQKVFDYVNRYLSCQSEVIINSLPVDIVCKDYLIHFDGPSHYVFTNENNYEPSIKEVFHNKLLHCKLSSNQESPKYIHIHLDYQHYNVFGNKYVKTRLMEAGLTLSDFANKTDNLESVSHQYRN